MNEPKFIVPASTPIGTIGPNHFIEICNPEGKKAIFDFNGDTLIVSGDLGLDEAARIFFDSVGRCISEEIQRLEAKVKELEDKWSGSI